MPLAKPPEPERLPGPDLPDPSGLMGHWRYTTAVVSWFRAWRGRIAAEDAAVRAAVDRRDSALVALGEAARALSASTPGDRELSAFAANLSRFESDAGKLDNRQRTLVDSADRARADNDAAVGSFDARLTTLRQTSAPQEQAMKQTRARRDDLLRQHTALSARQQRAPEASVAADLARNEAARAELDAEVARHEASLAALRKQAEALTEEQRLVRKAGEREVAELQQRADRAVVEVGDMENRRRATLMDLGHEAMRRGLSAEPLIAPQRNAREALMAVESVCNHRDRVLAERRQIDLAPCARTLAAAAALMIGLILLVLVV